LTASEKNTCSICGKYKDIIAKLVNEAETFYCKECHDKQMQILSENFNKIKFYCIKCGSSNLTQDDPKTGISLTDVPSVLYANAILTCNDCRHSVFVNMEDQGKIK
jgi:hypothetical protein